MAKILYFGRLVDVTGCPQEERALASIKDTATLRAALDEQYGATFVFGAPAVRIAINGSIAVEPSKIKDTDEIAFMPPVGGG